MKWAKEALKSLFILTDLEELKHHLGVSFKRMRNAMFLSQSAYCSHILKPFGMEIVKRMSSSMVENIRELFLELLSS